ncbi:hypothetical protein ACOMHN_051938 [Nucella lapillus]
MERFPGHQEKKGRGGVIIKGFPGHQEKKGRGGGIIEELWAVSRTSRKERKRRSDHRGTVGSFQDIKKRKEEEE